MPYVSAFQNLPSRPSSRRFGTQFVVLSGALCKALPRWGIDGEVGSVAGQADEKQFEGESLMSSFTRKIAALVTPLVLLGGFSVLGAQSAGAAGTTHKVLVARNPNNLTGVTVAHPAIETKAKLKFTCNSTTGSYTVSVKNFSIIGGDDTILLGALVNTPLHIGILVNLAEPVIVPLTQNSATELFDANVTNTLTNKADCHSGADIRGGASDTGDGFTSYNFLTTLS
jgi:hypothetical protein